MKKNNSCLNNWRFTIDSIDKNIVNLISRRMKIVEEIGRYKKLKNLPAFDKNRWKQVINEKQKLANKYGLSEKLITDIYNLIHEYALKIEAKI